MEGVRGDRGDRVNWYVHGAHVTSVMSRHVDGVGWGGLGGVGWGDWSE